MAAVDPEGAQKYWHPFGGTFATLKRTGLDPGSQKYWVATPRGDNDQATTLDGLLGSTTPPTPGGPTGFPALTVAP
jgi:hypothetical protein